MKNWLPLTLICGVLYTLGDLFMKKWALKPSWSMYLLGALMYVIGMNFLAFSYRFKNIAVATALAVIFNIIALTVISITYFKEPLTIKQMFGLILSISAIFLLG